jgi:hypothetical protein
MTQALSTALERKIASFQLKKHEMLNEKVFLVQKSY